MGDWDDSDALLEELAYKYNDAFESLMSAEWHLGLADYNTNIGGDWQPNIGFQIVDTLEDVIAAVYSLVDLCSNEHDPPFGIPYYLKHYAGGVTWKAICEAWVKDDFEGRNWTIAIIDKMRQILWDEPFDIQWAARPTGAKT